MNKATGQSEVRFSVPRDLATESYAITLINRVGKGSVDFEIDEIEPAEEE